MKKIKLLFLSLLSIILFSKCSDDEVTYPGEKENIQLYGVGLSSVLVPGIFIETYSSSMKASGDTLLATPISEALDFALAHFLAANKFFIPSGDILEGSLSTTAEPIGGVAGPVIVYYFSKGGEDLAYQVSATSEGFMHQGYVNEAGNFTLQIEAEEVIGATSSGILNEFVNGSIAASTSWSYSDDDILTVLRESSPSGASSEFTMSAITNSGDFKYFESGNLIVESDWAGASLEGTGFIYNEAGALVITGDWPLIPVPDEFDNYRIALFGQEGLYDVWTTADGLVQTNVTGQASGAWGPVYAEMSKTASIMYIPPSATVEVTPSGLKRTYNYTAINGETVSYSIQATTPTYEHLITVNGVLSYTATEDRESTDRSTLYKRLVDVTARQGTGYIFKSGATAQFMGRGTQGNTNQYMVIDVAEDNSIDWKVYFANPSPDDIRESNFDDNRIWIRGSVSSDGTSGDAENWFFSGGCCANDGGDFEW